MYHICRDRLEAGEGGGVGGIKLCLEREGMFKKTNKYILLQGLFHIFVGFIYIMNAKCRPLFLGITHSSPKGTLNS